MRIYRFVVRKAILAGLHSPTAKHAFLAERMSAVLMLAAFLFVQAVGFLESMSRHVDEAYATSYALEIWLPRLLYPLIAAFLLIQSGRSFIQRDNLLTISVVGALVLAAIQVAAGEISPAILAAVFFVVWINQWMPTPGAMGEVWFESYVVRALLIYLIAPIALLCLLHLANMIEGLPERFQFIIDRTSNDGLFRGESFRGFARDRIAYSYLCGIAFMYLLSGRNLNARIFMWMGLLLIALLMGGARAVLVALVSALCFMVASKRIALFCFVGGLAVLGASALLSGRPGFFGDPGDRINIFFAYLDHMQANPTVLLIGEGHFGADIQLEGGAFVRPHSWLLNSIVNFGALTTAAWIFFLYKFFKKNNAIGRSVFIYFITVGFFHNGFDAYLFSMEQLLGFLLTMTLCMKTSQSFLIAGKDGRGGDAPQLIQNIQRSV